ncbi:GDSL lipase/esterase [Dichotomocladium elegans]|nr:GDSL lipase/esterase [Dichotomocladium elegans]
MTARLHPLTAILLLLTIVHCYARPVSDQSEHRLVSTPRCWESIDTVFVFGDSYSAIGGEAGSSSTWNLFETKDAVSNDSIILNMTSAGGANWNEYLVGCFEGLPQDCKPKHLFNLAYNGATINDDLVEPWRPIITDFRSQTQLWKTHLMRNVQWDNALVMAWFGINDVSRSTQVRDNEIEGLILNVLTTYFEQLDILYAQNMRRFVLINVPPVDRTPKYASIRARLGARIGLFNSHFRSYIHQFQETHRQATVIEINAHEIFSTLLDRHETYGIQNITGFYKQNKDMPIEQYFWNDNLHPTYPVHKAFADEIRHQLQSIRSC